MCCKSFWKKFVPFSLALIVGLVSAKILQMKYFVTDNQEVEFNKAISSTEGRGDASCRSYIYKKDSDKLPNDSDLRTKPLQILSKPRANYAVAARENEIQGIVRLRLTFLASGQIGNIYPIQSLPDGLTEQAINAAMQIKFAPQTQNGKPINVTKVIEYSFTIY